MHDNDISSFGQFDYPAVLAFISFVRKQPWKRGYQANVLAVLTQLFDERERMPEGERLSFNPFAGLTSGRVVGYRESDNAEVQPIANAIAVPLLRAAVEWVQHASADILEIESKLGSALGVRIMANDAWSKERAGRIIAEHQLRAGSGELRLCRVDSLKALRQQERHLISACYIVIAFFSGPRIHEILSFEEGCVRGPVLSADETLEIFYVRGRTSKVSPEAAGLEREWVIGARPNGSQEESLGVAAIHVLEKLRDIRGVPGKTLIFSSRFRTPLKMSSVNSGIRDFAKMILGRPVELRSHQLRRTYSEFVTTHHPNILGALAQQFGHINIAHTMKYSSSDIELNKLLDEAEASRTAEALMGILRSENLAGGFGSVINEKIAPLRAHIATEPKLVEIVSRLVEDSDVRIYPAFWGICYFRASSSECGGKHAPNFVARRPDACLGCSNLVVTEQHRPFLERRIADNESNLANFPHAPEVLRCAWQTKIAECRELILRLQQK